MEASSCKSGGAFASSVEENSQIYDILHFMEETVKSLIGPEGRIMNATYLMIHLGDGARVTMNANEISHFEFGAVLGSSCMFEMLQNLDVNQREIPKVWKRIRLRRDYMRNVLGIYLKPEILPLSNTEGWLCPLLLAKDKAIVVNRKDKK